MTEAASVDAWLVLRRFGCAPNVASSTSRWASLSHSAAILRWRALVGLRAPAHARDVAVRPQSRSGADNLIVFRE
jgi:hypothetical protein